MRRLFTAFTAALLAVGLLAVAPAGAVGGTTNVTVFHGIPGLTVDVYVDGALALDDFTPGTVAGPLTLAAGAHEVAITADDAADDSAPILGPATVNLIAGADQTIAAHLTEAGDPTVSVFNNDTSAIAAGNGRLTVRHLASAPAVDVDEATAGDVFTDVANGQSAAADLPAATYEVSLEAAGTEDQVFPASGTVSVALPAATNLIVYAYGTLGTDFALATQAIDAPIGAPATVSVVHGVPGATVDVYIDGLLLLEDFEPGTVAGPVLIPAGVRDVELFAADAAYAAGTGLLRVEMLMVPAGANVSVVAHLTDDGDAGADVSDTLEATVYVNDTSTITDGEARLVVRHVADAPTVDVLTGTTKLVDSLANNPATADEQAIDVAAGTYPVTVNAEDGPAVADLGDVTLVAGNSTIVYAYGELAAVAAIAPSAADTFNVTIQSIVGLAESGAFPDTTGRFFTDDVRTMLQLGITTGTSATTYEPERSMTRGEMAAFINRTLGSAGLQRRRLRRRRHVDLRGRHQRSGRGRHHHGHLAHHVPARTTG